MSIDSWRRLQGNDGSCSLDLRLRIYASASVSASPSLCRCLHAMQTFTGIYVCEPKHA